MKPLLRDLSRIGVPRPVDLNYRLKGVENVYLTTAALDLWPTGGSWNPTCTVSGMAMHKPS